MSDLHETGTIAAGSATMQDIADRLNISVATVSRALRRMPGINPETRSRVFQTATELGYRLAKSYRTTALEDSQLHHVGVFIQTPQTHVPAPFYLAGMSDASVSLNASLVVHYLDPSSSERILRPEFQPSAMRSGLLSGIILIFRRSSRSSAGSCRPSRSCTNTLGRILT